MLPRLSPLLRATLPADAMAARVLSRAVCTASLLDAYGSRSYSTPCPASVRSQVSFSRSYSSVFGWRFGTFRCRNEVGSGEYPKVFASQRAYRKVQRRRRPANRKEKELELNVKICIEEQLPDDPEILIMAIGDGENDVEMLELASLGVALSNGSDKAKAVANVIGASNDEDGAADAIYRYAF